MTNQIKNYIKLLFIIIEIIIIISLTMKIVNKMQPKFNKVLIIGIDAMDPKVTKKLMDDGRLPNFKKLSDAGSFLILNTSLPPETPVAWTSIATGVNPGKHNLFDFIRRDPNTYLPELSLTKSHRGFTGTKYESYVRSSAFWEIMSNERIPVTVIRWPVTFPPKKIKGNMLSGLGVPDIKGFLGGYTYYTSKNDKKSDKPTNKVIKVLENAGMIETEIYGPKLSSAEGIKDIKLPLLIKLNKNSAQLTINNKQYQVKLQEWSVWIPVEFKVGIKKLSGIFKIYLISTDPFEMYMTSIHIDPTNPITDISYPSSYSAELAKDIGIFSTLGMPEETDGYDDDMISEEAFLEQINQIEAERDKMFWLEFKRLKDKEGVFAFVYDSLDRLQHVFWEDMVNSKEFRLNDNIIDYYVRKDKLLAEVIKQMDNETLLLIFSDHGFSSFEKAVSINTWFVDNGYITLTRDLNDIEDSSLFEYVDWSKTKAYAIGFTSIYINEKGREVKGIVEDKEKVLNEIIEKLENLEDDGNKVINKVYRREDVYFGDQIKNAPDLIIGFNPGYRMSWQTAIGGFTEEIIYENQKKWIGDHLVDPKFVPGVLFSNVKFNRKSATILDIAPSILDAQGIKIPKEMDGKSLI